MSEENKNNTDKNTSDSLSASVSHKDINHQWNAINKVNSYWAGVERQLNSSSLMTLQKNISKIQKDMERIKSVNALKIKLPQYYNIQSQLNNTLSALAQCPQTNAKVINSITQTYRALCNAEQSDSLEQFRQQIKNAKEAAEEWSDSSSSGDSDSQNYIVDHLADVEKKAENAKEKDLPILQNSAAEVKATFDESISEKVSSIESTLSVFLAKFDENAGKLLNASQLTQQNIEKLVNEAQKNNAKIADLIGTAEKNGNTVKELLNASQLTQQNVEALVTETQTNNNEIKELLDISKENVETVKQQLATAEKNGNTVKDLLTASKNNFEASKVDAKKNTNLSYVAIGIAVVGIIVQIGLAIFDYCTDNHEKIIEILQSKSFCSPKIHIEKSSNVKVALEKGTIVSQDDVKLMQKTNRLQADLKKAQDTLSGLEKKYNAATAGFALEKQKLYAEIAALKKQIEDLKAELIKRPVPQSVSRQEAENE